jgi:hypothetical protein
LLRLSRAQYVQSAAAPTVELDDSGVMTTPYSCLLNTADACTPECQADLDLFAAACHAEDSIKWDGNGVDPSLARRLLQSGIVAAPTGTTITPAGAFMLFQSGVAMVPTNTAHGVASDAPLPLDLSACTSNDGVFPNYSPPPPPPPPPPLPPPPPPPSPSPPTPPPPPPPPPSPTPPPVRAHAAAAVDARACCTSARLLASDARLRFRSSPPSTQAPPTSGLCAPFSGTGRIQVQCEVYGVTGQTFKIGTVNKEAGQGLVLPGTACTDNTYLGLYLKSAMSSTWGSTAGRVAYNDDSGMGTLCSFISYTAVNTGKFVIQGGCYDMTGTDSCSGTIAWLLQ